MTRDLLNATTATSDNALTEAERDALLAERLEARLGTNRADGWPHITPIWYLWQEGTFLLSLGNSRRHIDNLRRDSHVTLCVDIDHRPEGPGHAALAAVCFGEAELIEDEQGRSQDHREHRASIPGSGSSRVRASLVVRRPNSDRYHTHALAHLGTPQRLTTRSWPFGHTAVSGRFPDQPSPAEALLGSY